MKLQNDPKLIAKTELLWEPEQTKPFMTYGVTDESGNICVYINLYGFEMTVTKCLDDGDDPKWKNAVIIFPEFGKRDVGAATSIKRLIDECCVVSGLLDCHAPPEREASIHPLSVRTTGFAWEDYTEDENALLDRVDYYKPPHLSLKKSDQGALSDILKRRGGKVYFPSQTSKCVVISDDEDGGFKIRTTSVFSAIT